MFVEALLRGPRDLGARVLAELQRRDDAEALAELDQDARRGRSRRSAGHRRA